MANNQSRRTNPSANPRTPVIFLLVGWLFLAMAAIYFRAFRATVSDGVRKGVVFAVAGVVVLLQIVPVSLGIGGLLDTRMPTALLDILALWARDILPGGTLTVWVLCAALFYLGYRITEQRFRRIEVPVSRTVPES